MVIIMAIKKMAGKSRGYNFLVVLEETEFPCSRVSGIERIKDTETVSQGGVNDRVYTLAGGSGTERVLILERGAGMDISMDHVLQVGYRFSKDVLVYVRDIHQKDRYVYTFSGCYVKKVSYSDLDALRSEVVMERMELSYEEMTRTAI